MNQGKRSGGDDPEPGAKRSHEVCKDGGVGRRTRRMPGQEKGVSDGGLRNACSSQLAGHFGKRSSVVVEPDSRMTAARQHAGLSIVETVGIRAPRARLTRPRQAPLPCYQAGTWILILAPTVAFIGTIT